MKREHQDSSESDDSESDTKLECSLCSKTFVIQKYLKQHMQKHLAKVQCDQCGQKFSFASNLSIHKRNKHGVIPSKKFTSTIFTCDVCSKSFGKKYNLIRHRACVHQVVTPENVAARYPCRHCDSVFINYRELVTHVEKIHPLNQQGGRQTSSPKTIRDNLIVITPKTEQDNEERLANDNRSLMDDTALHKNVHNRFISPRQNERYDVLIFFANVRNEVMTFLRSQVRRLGGIKWNLCVQIDMQREDNDEGRIVAPYFRSRTYVSLSLEDMNEHDLNEAFQKMFESLEKYMRDGSGWFIKEVLKLEIHTVVYKPLAGSSYIPLPKTLALSNSVINIQTWNDKCFLYCILASLHPTQVQPEQMKQYIQYEDELNMSGIEYPVTLRDIHKFENQNDTISVNVFTFEDDSILPLRVTTYTQRLHHANLLWLKNEDTSHYCLISDLNRFLSRTKSCKNKQYFCPYCLHAFCRADLLKVHQPNCSVHGPQKVMLPAEHETVLTFKDYEKTLKVPFVIYADFETINRKIHTCAPNPQHSSTYPTTKLEVCSFGYKVVCEDRRYTKPTVVYRGSDAAQKLIECLLEEQRQITNILAKIEPMKVGTEHHGRSEKATHCCLCEKEFSLLDKTNKMIVTHHNHLTGEIIGAACNDCNLNCKQAKFTCVFFHNLKNFDAHILCETLGQFKEHKLTCIAQNSERYVSFSLGGLRFLDSYQFLGSSLETLVCNLKQDGLDAFPHLLSEFECRDQAKLLVRKGVYPYDYMDSLECFAEKEIPPAEKFYSSIKKEGITEEDYTHAQRVFREFNMKTLGEYHDLYLKTDVLLLSDVFEAFRKMCLSQYGLDCCHFYTSPGLSWASLLKMTRVKLELLTNIDQLLMIEAGIRGGISQISKRYQKANNPYLEDYDPNLPTTYIQYLDANNLYGWAMVQPLPIGDFKFLDDIGQFDIMTVPEAGEYGYILEVTLHYPSTLHSLHNCLPLAAEQRQIDNNQLSPYAQQLLRNLYNLDDMEALPNRGQVGKLLTTLYDKNRYVVHYRNLQLYIRLGLELKVIHRILRFRQKAWMKPYIEFNTEMRRIATSTFQKNFYKLMNVSVFGKTMENVRKHKNIELVHQEERLRKLSAKPTYKRCTIFKEDLVAVELLRAQVKLSKPSYSGMCILDLSKYLMYDFWYNYIKKRYPTAELLMTDTDSLLYACRTNDIYEDMQSSLHLFDTSDYAKDHPLYNDKNKKALGKMKDETCGQPISEFVGLRSKMYSFLFNRKEEKRAKGIAKVTIDKDIKHVHYKETLFEATKKVSSMNVLRSHQHELFCNTIHKIGLSAFDDKRYLLNSTESVAYGHCKVTGDEREIMEVCDKSQIISTENDLKDDNSVESIDGQLFDKIEDQSFMIGGYKVSPCVKYQ